MKQEILARTIIDTLIRKFFRDMESDPDRSIRNMIDLGINFAKGRFQKEFFQVLQEMLANEQSAYYDLVKRIVANTDQEKLRLFGINLGFQACTLGANIIRENEEKWNFNIPWAYRVVIGEEGISAKCLDKLIREGKELGTFVYVLSSKGQITREYTELLQKHSDCAFILLTTPEEISGNLFTLLKDTGNLLVLVEYQENEMDETIDELQKHGFLYGTYEIYHAGHQPNPWDSGHLEQIAASEGAVHVLMPQQPYDFQVNTACRDAVALVRRQQEYPFILIDYSSDIQRIDQIISNDSCAVAFDENGCVHTDTGEWKNEKYNIRYQNLFDILNQVTKKRQAD